MPAAFSFRYIGNRRCTYDTYNRLRQLIYPDNEVLTYSYNSGGLAESASGLLEQKPNTEYRYTLTMQYDSIHNIVSKNQEDIRIVPGGSEITQKKTTYDYSYAYTGSRPHAPTQIGERAYSYDANGNQTGWESDENGTRRTIVWDEENRIQEISDNGHTMRYAYNDAGERVIKTGPQGETVYVNQFYSVRNREVGSKHVFVGTGRIVTKLVKGQENVTTPGTAAHPGNSDPSGKAKGHSKGNNGGGSGGGASSNGTIVYEKDIYYYHPDHLGSSTFISDAHGELYQHLENFPFGETWVEESTNTQRTPYHFTAKELDEETGLYFFGARYYDPRTSVWQSPDPILGDYLPTGDKENDENLPGMGGVFNSSNIALYIYVQNKPTTQIDPDGLFSMNLTYIEGFGFGFKYRMGALKTEVSLDFGSEHYPVVGETYVTQGAKIHADVLGMFEGGLSVERKAEGSTQPLLYDQYGRPIMDSGTSLFDILEGSSVETLASIKKGNFESSSLGKFTFGAQFLLGAEIEVDFSKELEMVTDVVREFVLGPDTCPMQPIE